VERVEKSVEIDCPIRTVYNQWTQFEEFPRFISGVKEVEQLEDTHVRWHATIFGKDKACDVEITEQVPDERISWRSTSGAQNAGTVRIEPLPANRTLVDLAVSYDPHSFDENADGALGLFGAHVENTLQDLKSYIEKRQVADGAWRGEVHGGQRSPTVSDRRPTDARTRQ
jgi:uncharacterized membrane protein